jgi:sulfopyruvate decarboxylase beta subunit
MNVEQEIITYLKQANVKTIYSVPCAKIQNLLKLLPTNFEHFPLTREEEGIGLITGEYLSGRNRCALIMQNGGLGNSINAIMSLAIINKVPLPMIISWRGVYNEKIAAQLPMGKVMVPLFKAMDIPYVEILEESDIPKIKDALDYSFENEVPYGILCSPKIWENSEPLPAIDYFDRSREISTAPLKKVIKKPSKSRFEILQGLKSYLKDKIIISNIGVPSKELYAVCDQKSNFYMTGSLGMVSLIGMGVAKNTQKKVVVIDGDGSILTNPNALCSIGQLQPKNLTILAIDNGTHGSTGNQITPAYIKVDLESIARGFEIKNTASAYSSEEVLSLVESLSDGLKFIEVYCFPKNEPLQPIPMSPMEIRDRFMNNFE